MKSNQNFSSWGFFGFLAPESQLFLTFLVGFKFSNFGNNIGFSRIDLKSLAPVFGAMDISRTFEEKFEIDRRMFGKINRTTLLISPLGDTGNMVPKFAIIFLAWLLMTNSISFRDKTEINKFDNKGGVGFSYSQFLVFFKKTHTLAKIW